MLPRRWAERRFLELGVAAYQIVGWTEVEISQSPTSGRGAIGELAACGRLALRAAIGRDCRNMNLVTKA